MYREDFDPGTENGSAKAKGHRAEVSLPSRSEVTSKSTCQVSHQNKETVDL